MIAKGYAERDLFTIDNDEEYRYVECEGGIKIIGYSGLRQYIEIPEMIDGKKVVALGLAEEGYPGSRSFNLLLPNTVSYIDPKCNPISRNGWISGLFLKEDNENFVIEDGFLFSKDKKILYFCLEGEEDEKDLIIPDGVECIGEYAFLNQSFENITIPLSVKSIGSYAFSSGYNKVEIPESVEVIGDYIANNVTLNGKNENYKIEDGCIYTSDGKTLVQCVQKDNSQIVIPDTVEEIRPYAFYRMRITKLELGTGVKKIGENAFNSAEVKTIRIPDQLVELADNAFGYAKCNSVRVGKANNHFYSDGICFFSIAESGEKRLLKCFKNKEEEYEIPEGVTSIAPKAFAECISMKKISLPRSMKYFDESCLSSPGYNGSSCAVKKLEIPENVEELKISSGKIDYDIVSENSAFFVEDGIIYHRSPEGLEIIAAKGVSGELTIKSGVTIIKAYAFSDCRKITKVTCNNELRVIEHHAFSNGWDNNQIEEVSLNEGIEYIDYLAFSGSKVGKVYLPASLKYICVSAFYKCDSVEYDVAANNMQYLSEAGALYTKTLTELRFVPKTKAFNCFKIPSGVTDIGCAFRGCKNVDEIVVPATVQCIWRDALECDVKDIYFEGDIKSFDYTGVDLWKNVKIHADAGSGAAQYVEWIKESRGDVKIRLLINGVEDVSGLSKDYDVMLNDTGITIIKALKTKKIMEIPEKIGNYPVTKIASRAFEWDYNGNDPIEEIVIPDSVIEIGNNTFCNRKSLRNVVLPRGLKIIPKSMFIYCEALEEVTIPNGVEEINEAAFFGCKNIKRIYFPESVKKISEFFMADENGQYKDLYLSKSTAYIVEPGSYSEGFLKSYKSDGYDCKQLVVIYPNQASAPVTDDEKEALEYLDYTVEDDGSVSVCCKSYWQEAHPNVRIPSTIQGMPVTRLTGLGSIHNSMETLYVPESVLSIEGLYRLSFYSGGQNMKRIEVADNNPNYWSDGKALYTKDKSILIHMFDFQAEEYEVCSDTKEIGESAFGMFSNLKKLVLPDGLKVIHRQAFYDCSKLEDIIGVEKVETIEEGVLAATPYYNKLSILFSGSVLQKYNETGSKTYEIPEGTTEIAKSAFSISAQDEDVLETIVVPASVRTIGAYAFSGRRKLKSVNIPDGVDKIESKTFAGCESLEKIIIPASVKEIAIDAFPVGETPWRGTPVIPQLSAIEVNADNEEYCSVEGVLYSKDNKTLVLVPYNYGKTEFVVPECVETIGKKAFAGNKTISKIRLSNNVRTISQGAFEECEGLEEINLDLIETIESAAFGNCKKLKTVKLRATNIGDRAFSGCINLKTIVLEETKIIGGYAFAGCGLTKLNLPDGLEKIGENAFAGCSLKEVIVPKTVLETGNESFSGCPEITIYDTIDPNAKPCTEYLDDVNGHPNSIVGFIGIGPAWAMWECAANHNWVDHEIIVRSADTDEIKYKVWMGSDPKQRKYYCTLTSSWGKCASFNFSALDEAFSGIKGVNHKIKVALNRLQYPEMLSDAQKNAYVTYLVRSAKDLIVSCIDNDDMETLLFCEPFGVIKKNNIDDLLDYAAKKKATQFSAYLIEYKNKNFGGGSGKARIPSLSIKVEEPWAVSKSASTKVGRYKGNETDVEFPKEIKGKKMNGVAGTTSSVPDNYKNIISVILPEGYTTIGDYAFYGCTNLEKITLPSTLETIGKDAFHGCSKLKEVIMPDKVKEIGSNSFRGCSGLVELKLSNKLKNIPGYAFAGCSSLKKIIIPESVISLEKGSFESYGVECVVVNSSKLTTYGQCFGSVQTVYAREGVMKGVYGIAQRIVKPLETYGAESTESDEPYFAFDNIDKIEFDGKIFVLTGFGWDEEEKITEIITSKGGEVKSSTVLKTNYLIVMEEYDHKTSKYNKAVELKEKGKELYIIGAKRFYELAK